MTFAWPAALLGLLLVPAVVAAYVLVQRRRMRYAARFTNLDLLANVVERSPGWRRHLPALLALAALASLLVALARPQVSSAVPRKRTTVVLAIDVSGSMAATDVSPTRLAAAKAAAQRFVERLPHGVRVGLVAFAGEAQVASAATDDREAVAAAIQTLRSGGGTAIGDAIVRSLEVGRTAGGRGSRSSSRRPFSVLLLSDGKTTSGTPALEAARRAHTAGVPVYTVALGTPQGSVQVLDDFGIMRTIRVPPDPATLRRVAETTGARFFDAPDEGDLQSVYDRLSTQVAYRTERHEIGYAFAGAAAALLLAGMAFSVLWFHRLP